MKLSSLQAPEGSRKNKKRIGRGDGSGHGGTSTKGHKGQNARSGRAVKPGFEGGQMPLSRRLPKRGFRNPFRKEYVPVNIDSLKVFPEGAVVDLKALLENRIVKGLADGVKLLGRGEIGYALTVRVHRVSRAAKEKIEASGGTVEVI
jgi:large subunit ribosomal protein L15